MANEIKAVLIQFLLEECRRAGMDPPDLDLATERLGPDECVDWDVLVQLLNGMLARAGGEAPFAAMMAEAQDHLFPGDLCRELFDDARTFFLWMASAMPLRMNPHIQTSVRLREDGAIVCEHHIPRTFTPCRSLGIATVGLFRGFPRIFGLPDADVTYSGDGYRAHFVVRLPEEPQLVRTRVSPLKVGGEARRNFLQAALREVESSPWAIRVGRELMCSDSLGSLAHRMAQALGECFQAKGGTLWVQSHEGEMEPVLTWGEQTSRPDCAWPLHGECEGGAEQPSGVCGPPRSSSDQCLQRMLAMGGRILGRIEVLGVEESPALEDLFSWVSVAVDVQNHLPTDRSLGATFVRELGLTARQRQVLFLLIQGLADKEIAQALGTSPKTVGHQVSAMLQKAGVSSRAALVARSMAGLPTPVGRTHALVPKPDLPRHSSPLAPSEAI